VEQEFARSEEISDQPLPADDTVVVDPTADRSTNSAENIEPTADKKQDPWKTAFIVLVGIVMLSAVLIYSTSSRRTEPTTVLQTDANGQPVQPLNPASGVEEERLAAMPSDAITSNSNLSTLPGQLPGGDGYDPWANAGKPPTGAPTGPGGGYVTIPNGGASQFMPPECILQPSGIYLCPVPTNSNAAVKPSPTPRGNNANANAQAAPTPGTTASPKPTPSPRPSPTPRARNTPAPAKTPAPEN
jgi:hypothetical protein